MTTLVERMKQTGAPVYHAEAAIALEACRVAIEALQCQLSAWVEIAEEHDQRSEDDDALALAATALTLLDAQA